MVRSVRRREWNFVGEDRREGSEEFDERRGCVYSSTCISFYVIYRFVSFTNTLSERYYSPCGVSKRSRRSTNPIDSNNGSYKEKTARLIQTPSPHQSTHHTTSTPLRAI